MAQMKLGIADLPESDLLALSEHLNSLKELYNGRRVLLYGGTGFIGTWLTAGFLKAKLEFNLDLDITIITRDRIQAEKKFGFYSNRITFVQHDFSKGPLYSNHIADIVIHAATPTKSSTGAMNFANTLTGTTNAALHAKTISSTNSDKPYVLHLSSGSIYGAQPMSMQNRLESDKPILDAKDSYTQAKLSAEGILLEAYKAGKINYQSPRLFAFTGPLISLSHHYAVGNFLQDGLNGEKIKVKGSPSTLRSYIHPLDLVRIIMSMVALNEFQELNIGNDLPISMFDLASKISSLTSNRGVQLLDPEALPTNYVPSILNLRRLVWQQEFITLDQALEKWIFWLDATNRGAKGV